MHMLNPAWARGIWATRFLHLIAISNIAAATKNEMSFNIVILASLFKLEDKYQTISIITPLEYVFLDAMFFYFFLSLFFFLPDVFGIFCPHHTRHACLKMKKLQEEETHV